MSMFYNPKTGWQVIQENRPVQQTQHRMISESSVQNLEMVIHQLLDNKTLDYNQVQSEVQRIVKKWREDDWTRNNSANQPGMEQAMPPSGIGGGTGTI